MERGALCPAGSPPQHPVTKHRAHGLPLRQIRAPGACREFLGQTPKPRDGQQLQKVPRQTEDEERGEAEPTGSEATPEAGAPSGLSTLRGQEPQSRGRGDPRQDSCAPPGLDTEVGTPGKQAPCSALLGH